VDLFWILSLLGQGNNWLDLNKLINCDKMSDTDDNDVLFTLMSAVSYNFDNFSR